MSLSVSSTVSGRSTTAAAVIDDVSVKRMVVLTLQKKLQGLKEEEEDMNTETGRLQTRVVDLKAFVNDDPEDKKAKKKLAKSESKLQVEVQRTNDKRLAIEATRADLRRAENALQEALEAKLAYRRQLLTSDSSSEEESSDEDSDDGNDDSGKLGNGGNNVGGGIGVEIAVPNHGTADLGAPLCPTTSLGSTTAIASQSVVAGKPATKHSVVGAVGNLPGNLEPPPVTGDVHQAPFSPRVLDKAIGTTPALTSGSPKAHQTNSSPLAAAVGGVADVLVSLGTDQGKAVTVPNSSGFASAGSPTTKSTSHLSHTFTTPDRTRANGNDDGDVPVKVIVTEEEVRPLVNCLEESMSFVLQYIFIPLKNSLTRLTLIRCIFHSLPGGHCGQ